MTTLAECSLEDLRLERLSSTEHLRAVQRSFDDDIARRVLAAEVLRVATRLPYPAPRAQLLPTKCTGVPSATGRRAPRLLWD